ncbi:MAG: methyltransferase [bacterium]|nr:methyltransferase [bacterium]
MTTRLSDKLLRMNLEVGSGAWQPTPHGEFMGQMLAKHNLVEGRTVLELGAGCANHTIVLLRQGAAHIVATEISADLLETTRKNVERNEPDADCIEYCVADWLSVDGKFDVLVTNPPFCKSGKQNRRYYIDSLILDGHKRLRPGGTLLFVQSSMADLAKTQRMLGDNGFEYRVLGERQGPFRDYYFDDETFMSEIQDVEGGFEVRDGKHYETLYVVAAELQPYSPLPGAYAPDA